MNMIQTIKVRYYAQLRDVLKVSEEDVLLNLPILEREILDILVARHPKQRDLFFSSRVAVHEGYVEPQTLLENFTEIDIISPVSGG